MNAHEASRWDAGERDGDNPGLHALRGFAPGWYEMSRWDRGHAGGGGWRRLAEVEGEEEVEPPDRPEVGPSLYGKNGAPLYGVTWGRPGWGA